VSAQRLPIQSGVLATHAMTVMDCVQCGEVFATLTSYDSQRRRDGRSFYCPNGHSQCYSPGKTIEQQRIEELERQVQIERNQRESAQRQRQWAERLAKGANIAAGKAKAAQRRLLHRVECGVCPHCQRRFKQLAAHIQSKHKNEESARKVE
jgi:hypothetical protein